MSTDTVLDTATKQEVKELKKWQVVFLNDDYTPMDFVVAILVRFYGKSVEEAEKITMDIHKNNRGIAGVYTQEVATHKANDTVKIARQYEHPLMAVAEPQP